MYLKRSSQDRHSQDKDKSLAGRIYSHTRPALFSLPCHVALLILASTISPNLLADITTSKSSEAPFYRQLIDTAPSQTGNTDSLLEQVLPSHLKTKLLVSNPEHEEDLAFNYLWMQQYQDGYKSRHGGSAAGKLLRMSLKALYRSRYQSSSSSQAASDDDSLINDTFSKLDYRLKVSDDKFKLGVKYEF